MRTTGEWVEIPLHSIHSSSEDVHRCILSHRRLASVPYPPCRCALGRYGPHKPGSVGKPTFIELAILDDDLNMQGVGVVGEVCIKGLTVTPGYVGNDKANEEGFRGGWFHTGDQGMLDSEGYLTLTGRIKELINRGGEKISPLEVDAVLLSNPKVAEAVSFALPDPKYGEEVRHHTDTKQRTLTIRHHHHTRSQTRHTGYTP